MTRIERAAGGRSSPGALDSRSAVLTDMVAWVVATDVAALARYNFIANSVNWSAVSVLALVLAAGQASVGALVLLYRGRYPVGSFDEIRALAVSATSVAVMAAAFVAVIRPPRGPRTGTFLAWPLAPPGVAGVRGVKRARGPGQNRPGDKPGRGGV